MILPKDVKGYNRIRDARIINFFVEDGISQTEIANKFKISQPRVCEILRAHSISVISRRKDWEKLKRIHSMNRKINDESIPFANTRLDILKELRKEYEGEKSDIEVHNHFTLISPAENQIADTRVSRVEL